MEQPGLTPKQQAVHDWLYAFWLAHGYPPTVREVQEHFGLASTNSVQCHVKALRQKGYLDSDSRRLVTNQARKALDALRERA